MILVLPAELSAAFWTFPYHGVTHLAEFRFADIATNMNLLFFFRISIPEVFDFFFD